MTNEEKADKICEKYGVSKLFPTNDECIAYSSAMEMAEWKDEQWKDSAIKLFKKLESEGYNDMVKTGFEIFFIDLMQIEK